MFSNEREVRMSKFPDISPEIFFEANGLARCETANDGPAMHAMRTKWLPQIVGQGHWTTSLDVEMGPAKREDVLLSPYAVTYFRYVYTSTICAVLLRFLPRRQLYG